MPEFRIVLVEPAFEETIGFVSRVMKNFGLRSLHVVNPIARLGAEGRSRGGHAQDILDSLAIDPSLDEALEEVDLALGTTAQRARSGANLLRTTMTPRELGSVLKEQKGIVALVFGREGTGLNNHELSQCDATVTIPTAAEYPTLNLSHAAAIVLYELFISSGPKYNNALATDDVKSAILQYLSESANHAGVKKYRIGLTTRALRNVLGRAGIRRREASLLAGTLRKIAETCGYSQGQVLEPAQNL